MKVTILGSGTSNGVPQMGCQCEVCTSADPRDKRLRTSSLIETGGRNILIDCGPDFRQQILRTGFRHLDAVLLTHEHYDHVGGLDDLRPFSVFGETAVYAEPLCARHLRERIPYCFTPADKRYPGVPAINLLTMRPGEPIHVGDVEILPVRVMHGTLPIVGFRIGDLAYITDMKTIPSASIDQLRGVRKMIVNGLHHKTHASHQTIAEAVNFVRSLHAEEAWIVHMSHRTRPHAIEDSLLPNGIHLAYDGLVIQW